MATLIPVLNSCRDRMTVGEWRIARRLAEKLEDEVLIWYDVPIGQKRRQPDFVILDPGRGLFILEVKDWRLQTIEQVNPTRVKLWIENKHKSVANPLKQARDFALAVKEILESDPALVQHRGQYEGRLVMPYAYGVAFTNITRRQIEAEPALRRVFLPHLVLYQDDFYENVSPLELRKRLWDMLPYQFGDRLTAEQITRVRYHLFPDIRLPDTLAGESVELTSTSPTTEQNLDLFRIMDIQQEQLARSLGDGHRVIHGVAGSGKTMILVHRCLHLMQQVSKPILVLCFNVTLAAKLVEMLRVQGEQRFGTKILEERVVVRNFHQWCNHLIETYRIPQLNGGQSRIHDPLVQRVIDAVMAGTIPVGQYGAVLIDEGHDFQPGWLKLVAQMVDPATNSLLLLYDDAQTIYEQRQRSRFSFKSVGIQAQGRTTILKLNYRNTAKILELAYEFAREVLTPTEVNEDDAPILVQPESAGRYGQLPELRMLPNFQEEVEFLAERAKQFQSEGIAWQDIAILYRERSLGEKIWQGLKQLGLPVDWVNRDKDSRRFNPADPSIKLLTLHSSKGLEFPVVLIAGLGYLPEPRSPLEAEVRLLYVGMTRAMDRLVLTSDRSSAFVQQIQTAMQRITEAE